MNPRRRNTLDGNQVVASVAHRKNEVIALYPITPASPIGERCDGWTAEGQHNIWRRLPDVVELKFSRTRAPSVLIVGRLVHYADLISITERS